MLRPDPPNYAAYLFMLCASAVALLLIRSCIQDRDCERKSCQGADQPIRVRGRCICAEEAK